MAVIETQGFKLDNSGKRIVVDPVTRIEGHLRIETRATPGPSSSASAACAPARTRWCRCARSKTR